MGMPSSCLSTKDNGDGRNGLESVKIKSIRFGDGECKVPISFDPKRSDQIILKSAGSREMVLEGTLSFKGRQFETTIKIQSQNPEKEENSIGKLTDTKSNEMEHEAAVKLQKVYKSFRTRRKLADCAVLVEQGWWKLIDFMELEQSSLLFFDMDKHESAISRWSRAKTRAAKVGKGLLKNDKARKLALQHWLEAIDPRHRYGHNLHFYYVKWLQSQSKQPFFYWLDVGEGKEANLEKCPRSKLQQQCVEYLGPLERKAYEVVLQDGKFLYKQTGELVHTTEKDNKAKWIFVLSASKVLYVGKKKKGKFQHSSFLAGGATIAAGILVVENGILKTVWPHSGHYQPTEENFQDFLAFLRENDVDLTEVKTSFVDEEDDKPINRQRISRHARMNSSDMDFTEALDSIKIEGIDQDVTREETHKAEQQVAHGNEDNGHESAAEADAEEDEREKAREEDYLGNKKDLLDEEVSISRDSILERINSKEGTRSYQLGKQLSCGWTTGAGPRIGCVRDYPSELQFRALEQLNLSPRTLIRSQ